MSLLGQALGGRYRLDAPLGAGGMATVYRAWDVELERVVAVKILASNLAADASFAARFRQEARTQARVHHPAIVAIYDVGEIDGLPFIVMEFVAGESLATRLGRQGMIAPDTLAPIVAAIASGIGALHARGLIHRDIKPHNILLPADGQAKLADFGLARGDATSELTLPGTALGTLGYLAPETLRGEPASTASDVYAFGVVAFQALTGQRPPTPAAPPSVVAPWLGDVFDEPLGAALGPAATRPDIAALGGLLAAAAATWARHPRRLPDHGELPAAEPTATVATEADSSAVTVLRRGLPTTSYTSAQERPSPRPRGRASAALLGGAVLVALAALTVWALGQRGAIGTTGSFDATSAATPSPSGSAIPSPSATAPPTPVSTATAVPTTSIQAAEAAISAFDQTVSDLQGGPSGLKGKDAKSLTDLSGQVRSALDRGDTAEARDAAGRLVDQSDKLAEHLSDPDATRLKAAAEAVQRAVEQVS